ncbi:MAG: hypothetical protein BRD50_08285 [Bacteroidetes bacterium SW_11_45_7]|nr:MAG: hypothetical protein BRD50_08285 [Bacteroidetes bacterium SW_11_45_7]
MRTVAGTGISFDQYSDVAYAGITLFRLPNLTFLDYSALITKTKFPSVQDLLSFREVPLCLKAWKQSPYQPDTVIMDGHGIAHPRRCGLACHFGLQVEVPTIGCARNILTGTFDEPSPP